MAAAAYRAGVELIDERTGLVHDYTRRSGVVSAQVILPGDSILDPVSVDRGQLWNAAEAAEKRKDSRTAREWVVALPAELGDVQRTLLARSFGGELARRYGVAVDVAIHAPDREGDKRNHHAHLLTTTRVVARGEGGGVVMGEKASIELSDTKRRAQGLGPAADEVTAVRQLWEQSVNQALAAAGRSERTDHRRLSAQGIDREATTHLGPIASEMERRGKASDRGDGNRQAQANNAERAQLSAQVLEFDGAHLARLPTPALRAEVQRRKPPALEELAVRHPTMAPIRAAFSRAKRGAEWCTKRLKAIAERWEKHIDVRRAAGGFMTTVQRYALHYGAPFGAVKASQAWLAQQTRMKERTERVLALREAQMAALVGEVRTRTSQLRPEIERELGTLTARHQRAVDVLGVRDRAEAQQRAERREQERAARGKGIGR